MAIGAPGDVDATFTGKANSTVLGVAAMPDGRIAIGGNFMQVGGPSGPGRLHVALLEQDGSPITNPTPGANIQARVVRAQPNGGVLIGGDFTTMNDSPDGLDVVQARLARLLPNGSRDTTFAPNPNASVYSIALQGDGKIVIAGEFTEVHNTARSRVARLNADGSLDTTFTPPAIGRADDDSGLIRVTSVAVQADGKVVIGGTFTRVGAETRVDIARLNTDGSIDTSFTPPVPNSLVNSVLVQPDQKIIMAGQFLNVGTGERIARLNADGTVDSSFSPGAVKTPTGGTIYSTTLQQDGRILIGGEFTTVAATNREYIARLESDGSLDPTFAPNANGIIQSIDVQGDGKVLVGGTFAEIGGATGLLNIARLDNVIIPAAPTGVSATAGDGQATVSWGATTFADSYTVTSSPDGRTCTAAAPATSCTVTGLSNGQGYTFTVRAANSAGTGPSSSATGAVTPRPPASPPAPPQQPSQETTSPAETAKGGSPVTPAPRRLAGRTSVRRGVATTSGRVPPGATRIIQTARSGARSNSFFLDMALQARARTARGRCVILRPARKGAARTYRCQMRLAKGTWTVITTARGKAGVVAQGTRRVVVRG
jgi:uncharacterized delta-60 repeat protein